MGRELQKKKNRSSVPRVRQKPKSKKLNNPRANPIIAANWDKSLSVAQNYRNLGLASRLNARTGGVEKHRKFFNDGNDSDDDDLADENDALAIGGQKASKVILDEVDVVRDPKTGKILEVVGDQTGKKRKANPLNDPLNDLEDEYEEKVAADARKPKKRVIEALEGLAARGEEKKPRKQSQREQEWIERLVKRHGVDYRAMSRDTKLNPMQQSPGDIKARVERWRQSQGANVDADAEMATGVDAEEGRPDHSHASNALVDDTKPRCTCKKSLEDFEATLPAHMRIKAI